MGAPLSNGEPVEEGNIQNNTFVVSNNAAPANNAVVGVATNDSNYASF